MSPFLNKALAYVGLRDHEFDDDDEYEEIEEPTHVSHTVYPDRASQDVFHRRGEDTERLPLAEDPRRSQAVVLPMFPSAGRPKRCTSLPGELLGGTGDRRPLEDSETGNREPSAR